MTTKTGRLGPRPGEPCVYCKGPIRIGDPWYGGKGDYWHEKCHHINAMQAQVEKKSFQDNYWKYEAKVYEDEYDDLRDDAYAYEEDKYHADGYNMGYNTGYEHGITDGKRQAEGELDSLRAILDAKGVPAVVPNSYGVGQAGRLTWFMDRNGYVIQELGNPDALK